MPALYAVARELRDGHFAREAAHDLPERRRRKPPRARQRLAVPAAQDGRADARHGDSRGRHDHGRCAARTRLRHRALRQVACRPLRPQGERLRRLRWPELEPGSRPRRHAQSRAGRDDHRQGHRVHARADQGGQAVLRADVALRLRQRRRGDARVARAREVARPRRERQADGRDRWPAHGRCADRPRARGARRDGRRGQHVHLLQRRSWRARWWRWWWRGRWRRRAQRALRKSSLRWRQGQRERRRHPRAVHRDRPWHFGQRHQPCSRDRHGSPANDARSRGRAAREA